MIKNNMKLIYKQSIVIWFVFMVFAILNGIARNFLYQEKLGDLRAHQISTLTGIIGFLFIIYMFLKISKSQYVPKDLLKIGFGWVLMTIAFEFLFGHYIAGNTWQKLLADYNIFAGKLWILILLTILLGPWAVDKFRKKQ